MVLVFIYLFDFFFGFAFYFLDLLALFFILIFMIDFMFSHLCLYKMAIIYLFGRNTKCMGLFDAAVTAYTSGLRNLIIQAAYWIFYAQRWAFLLH